MLARHLQAEGHAVEVVPVNPPFPRGLRRLRHYPFVRTALNQALYLPSLRRLRTADVVHVFAAAYWSFLLGPAPAILAGRSFAKRVILNYHSGEADDHLGRWGRLVHPFLRLADAIVVPSAYLRDVFARHGYRVCLVPNIVDLSAFRYRERAPLRPHLLSARNLEPHYRVGDVLEAFSLIRQRHPDATLMVAGTGSEGQRLRDLVASRGLPAVQFLGRVEPADMPRLYDAAHIFVNASVVDNQPLSVLEAFASGLPVVSTGAGGLAAMVRDGETGLRVPACDTEATALAVSALLDNPDRARCLARRGRAEVGRHTWAHVREAWAAAYGALPA
jgi:glycosyltransferase involved in cell wall biosynthesis